MVDPSPSEFSPDDPDAVAPRLAAVHARIQAAAKRFDRDPQTIRLVAISKKKPADMIRAALAAHQIDFGENYLQDALAKIAALVDTDATWHFVGDIQSNKTRDIAANFTWAHAIDRFKIARRLSDQRPDGMPPINICIQINIDDEDSKSGIAPAEAETLAAQIAELPNLRLRGLMTIPAYSDDFESQRKPFAALRAIYDRLNMAGHKLDTLSIGMSADLEAAIAEGATHVRVGTDIFGTRAT